MSYINGFIIALLIAIVICVILIFLFKDIKIIRVIFTILLIILVVILIVFVLVNIILYIKKVRRNEPLLIGGIINARGGVTFPANELPASNIGSEYTYSFWIYPSGWDYKYGKPKHVISRGSDPRNSNGEMLFNPGIWFYPRTSNLMIRFDTYGKEDSFLKIPNTLLENKITNNLESEIEEEGVDNVNPRNIYRDIPLIDCQNECVESSKCRGLSYNEQTKECILSNTSNVLNIDKRCQNNSDCNRHAKCLGGKCVLNFDSYTKTGNMNPNILTSEEFNPNNDCDIIELPLQRWSHITVSLWNRTTDVYLNGKLIRSCILKNVPKIPHKDPLYVCQDGGFDGFFGQLRYFNRALNADEIYKLYKKGPKKRGFLLGSNAGECLVNGKNKSKKKNK